MEMQCGMTESHALTRNAVPAGLYSPTVHRFPTLKRGANELCAYGAGAEAPVLIDSFGPVEGAAEKVRANGGVC